MRILLDENMPESVAGRLRALGHNVDTVAGLRLKGASDGALLGRAMDVYDLLFTKDVAFAEKSRGIAENVRPKLVRVGIAQARGSLYANTFMASFRETDWAQYISGDRWP